MQLFTTVAALASEHIPGQAFRVNTNQDRLIFLQFSFDQSDMFKFVDIVFKTDSSPFSPK